MENSLLQKRKSGRVQRFFNLVIHYRYFIALALFIVLVLCKVNGSSVAYWSNYVGSSVKTVVAGHARAIRSDEWEVLTPKVVAQNDEQVKYSLINQNVGTSGENMLISLGMPVWDIYTISKPLNWGYLLFGTDYGLSWYWNMKWLMILLFSFELCMIITKKNKLVSALGAFWIMLAPAVQWWFAQHVGDVTLYMEAIVVAFYYFVTAKQLWRKITFAFLLSLAVIGYVCPLYPPFQITFGYLAFILMVVILIDLRQKIRITKTDVLIIGGSVVFILLVLLHLYLVSKDAIHALSNTVYPGKRVSNGGGSPGYLFFTYLTNLYLPYKDITISSSNNCEISSFFNFLPAVVLALPIMIRRKTGNLKFGIPLAIYSLFFVCYLYVPIPVPIAKITLLSYVTAPRAVVAYAFAGAFLSIWALAEISRTRPSPRIGRVKKNIRFSRVYCAAVSIVIGILYIAAVELTPLKGYVRLRYYLAFILVLVVLNYLLLRGRAKIFAAIMLCVIFAAGATVNPVNIGTGALYNSDLSKEVQSIDSKDPSAVWIAVNNNDVAAVMGAFLYANGAESLGGVDAIPDLQKWELIDPSGKYNAVYNRSAHVSFDITQGQTDFQLTQSDAFIVNLNVADLKKLNVKYILSSENLTSDSTSSVKFTSIYSSSASSYQVYSVSYQ